MSQTERGVLEDTQDGSVAANKPFQYEHLLKSDSFSSHSLFRLNQKGYHGDSWNERFQQALALPETKLDQKLLKYTLLNEINRDFVSAAVAYAKTIISEYFIPDGEKSLRPQAIGGQAGGVKYLLRGIMFKLADGAIGPYESNDEAAARAMGHEISGANSYFRCAIPGLHLALQALIDYKGFRMHAQAELPINMTTLVIGTADSARSIHCSDALLQAKLKFAAQELNLREHLVNGAVLYSACDVEGHKGLDGRHYIIDLARAFPPESPRMVPHLSNQEYSIGQKVFAMHKTKSKTTGSFQLATIVFVHDPTNPNPYVLQGERMYDMIFQSDKSLAFKIPQSMIKNGQQSIFWRLLRPEFVKHRGQSLIEKYFTVSDIQNASGNADAYPEFEIQDSSRRNSHHLNESVQHEEEVRNYSGDGSKVHDVATAPAYTSQSIQGNGSDKNYDQYREIGKKLRTQKRSTEQQEVPLQQQQQHNHISNISQPSSSSSSHFSEPASCGAEDGYVSSYTAAEQLFEYQATPQSINICDTRNQSSTYDSMYSAADEICSGASVRSGEEVYSGYRSSSYSSSSEEYSHHYRNIYHNRNYYNYDNYMLHASSGGDSSTDNRNICQERGGIGDDTCSSEGTTQQKVEHATQMHLSALHGLPAGLTDSRVTESMDRQLLSAIPHDSDTSSAVCVTLRRLQTNLPLSSSTTPSLLIPSTSISHPHGAYHVEKKEAGNVTAEYSPSYMTAEELFGYQATAPEMAPHREQTTTTLGDTVQPKPYSRDNELHVNGVREGHGRSRSEGTFSLLQLTESSSAVKAPERVNNSHMSGNEHVNNAATAGTSMTKRSHGTPILIKSACVTDEPWKRRGRSESLDSAREHARTRTHQHPMNPVNGAINTLKKEDENDKNVVSLSDPQRDSKIQNSAVNGLCKGHIGDYDKNLQNRSVDTGSHSSLTTSEDMTRSTATKEPPPLSSDSLSAFSAADPAAFQRNLEVHEATDVLVKRLIPAMAKDLLLHGHPRDREGLSLSEYMHGHGVNLRHIGLLRSLLLQEIAAACDKGFERPVSASLVDIGNKIVNGSCSQIAPSALNINHSSTATSLPSTSTFTDNDSIHATTVETQSVAVDSVDIDPEGGGPNQIPGVFTPALDALQSELLLEALCRTLKNILRDMQRSWIKSQRISSEQGILVLVVQFLNLVTGAHSNTGMFWTKVLPDAMVLRFGRVVLHAAPDVTSPEYGQTLEMKEGEFEDAEKEIREGGCGERKKTAKQPLINLWQLIHQSDRSLLFALLPQLCAMTGIGISSECKKQLLDFEEQIRCTKQHDHKPSGCCYDNSDTTHNITNITDDYRFHNSGSRTYHSMSFSTHHPRQQAHFEFVMADITEILPVVKRMHQLDLCEGVMMSIAAEQRQKQQNSEPGIVLRLLGMASDRLRRALRAVPDDIKTRHALADAYQTEGAAHLQLISKIGLKHVVSVSRLRSVRSKLPPSPLTSPDLSLAEIGTPKHDLTDLEPSERARIDLANTAFRRYAELQYSLSHTRCCKLRLSYREDILGIILVVRHALISSTDNGQKYTGPTVQPDHLPIQRIESVEIHLKTFSLSFFLRHLAALNSKETKRKIREKEKDAERDAHHGAIVVEGGGGAGDDDDASCSSVNSLLSSTTCNTVATTALQSSKALSHMQTEALNPGNQMRDITTTRFLPLIVDEEHADRALSLLQEELLRLDRLTESEYEMSVCPDQLPVVSKDGLVLRKFSLNRQPNLGLPEFDHHCGFRVLSALMNSTVLSLCDSAETGRPISDVSISGYMRFHHMLLFMADRDPLWRTMANSCVGGFLNDAEKRTKDYTPDLGRFLINLLISDRGWDTEVATAVLNESLVRQVSWFLSPRKRKDLKEAKERERERDRNGVRGGTGPQSSAASLHSLSSDYDGSKKGHNSHPGGAGAQDDDCSSVLSSSNMHENRHTLSPRGKNSSSSHQDPESHTGHGANSTNHFSHTELALLETAEICPYRLVTTFEVSRRALRLMMFQVFFLRFIARKVTSLDTSSEGSNGAGDGDISNINSTTSKNSDNQSQSHILKVYNSSLGCPTAAMHSGMTEEHAAIMTVSNYPEFFQRVHLFFTPQQFTSMLRNAVRISVQRNYTTGVNLSTLGCCKIERTNISGESSTGSTDPGPCKEEILWDDVWKMYAVERATGPYSADKVIEMRKKVSGSKRQFQQQQQYLQQQQQQLQLRNSRAASPCRKSGYASGNNKATNNYNYMLRGSQSSYYRAGDNMYPINNGNGRHGSGYGYSQGQGQGVGTGMRHPYRPKSGINSVSGGGSAAGSVQETATLLLGAHNGSSGMNNNNNNSYNYSNYNNNYITNNSHSRNRPSQARNAPQKQDIRRTGNSAENLCSLLNAAATGAAPLGATHSGQSSVNSNNNNNSNNNDSNNSNNNSKPRKFSHKNSTMNNAMSVSGDRVRLHVFYQGKFVSIGGVAPAGTAAKNRYKDIAQQGSWVDAVTRVSSDIVADDVSDYNSSDDEPGRIRSYKNRSASSDSGQGSQVFHSGPTPTRAGDKLTPPKSHMDKTGTKSGGVSGRSGRGGRGGRSGGEKSGAGTGLGRGALGPSRADDSSLPSIEQSVALTCSTARSDTDVNRGTNMNAQSNRSSDNALLSTPAYRRSEQESASSKGTRGPKADQKGGPNSAGRLRGRGGGRSRGRRGGSGFGNAYATAGASIPLEGQYEYRESK